MLAVVSGERTDGPKFDATPTEWKSTPASIIFVQLHSNKTNSIINICMVLLIEPGSVDGMAGWDKGSLPGASADAGSCLFPISLDTKLNSSSIHQG